MIHFKTKEFVVSEEYPLSSRIVDKIWLYHIIPLSEVREKLGKPMYVRSGYRPAWWEHQQGRFGTSQHCFKDKGATDISLTQNSSIKTEGWRELFKLLCETDYNRITYYPKLQFFHLDYKGDERQYFINDEKWILTNKQQIINII